ncbi:MAG TPA: PH domain-containing protein [Acidimicrobiales bacterium]|nr:PH domain-containing protein [Acidimicrobiales bacterium]
MPLPRKFLNEDEELLAELRPHWMFMFGPLVTSIVTLVIVLMIIVDLGNSDSWATYPLLVVLAIPLVWLAGRAFRWITYTLALTTTRILVRHGIFDRDIVQLRLQRITEVNINQKLWERVFGTGRVIIDVQGEDDAVVLEDVRKPAIVQRVINSQINQLTGGGRAEDVPTELLRHDLRRSHRYHEDAGDPDETPPHGVNVAGAPTSAAPDVGGPDPVPTAGTNPSHFEVRDRLIELDDLHRRGIITDEEFAAKKAELLNRI